MQMYVHIQYICIHVSTFRVIKAFEQGAQERRREGSIFRSEEMLARYIHVKPSGRVAQARGDKACQNATVTINLD